MPCVRLVAADGGPCVAAVADEECLLSLGEVDFVGLVLCCILWFEPLVPPAIMGLFTDAMAVVFPDVAPTLAFVNALLFPAAAAVLDAESSATLIIAERRLAL